MAPVTLLPAPLASLLVLLLGLAFAALGAAKLLGVGPVLAAFARLRLPRWLRFAAGAAELVFGAALTASAVQHFLTFFAALPLLAICLGALVAHLLRGLAGWPVAAALALGLVAAVLAQPLGLRVALLPHADALPEALVAARTLATAAPGVTYESVAVAPDGSLLLTANAEFDLATGDTSDMSAQVLRRAPDGTETVLWALPPGTMAGALALAPDGVAYLTAGGAEAGIWRVAPGGAASLVSRVPGALWLNGLALGPDGVLYAADSAQGVIWRVDSATGSSEAALESPLLSRRPFVALAPGANGVRFVGRTLVVTNSDRATVLAARLGEDGRLGAPEVLARGIPGDDLAALPDGTLLVTTHPYNTVVRVEPDGTRTVIAGAAQGVAGATAAALGTAPDDEDSLYVVTDGGAFAGAADAAGTVIELTLSLPSGG